MSLTPAELAAARAFRAAQRRALDGGRGGPPDITASVYVHHERHDCAARGGKSVFLELREHYVFSPIYRVFPDGEVRASGDEIELVPGKPSVIISARRFGWIFTEGRCSACGMTARSGHGRLVDPETRPPSEHAIVG